MNKAYGTYRMPSNEQIHALWESQKEKKERKGKLIYGNNG